MLNFIITYKGIAAGVGKRDFNRIVAFANAKIAQHWHEKFRPRHFTWKGAKKYGYAKRVGKRQGGIPAKRGAGILKGSNRPPLVQSGRSRDRSAIFNIRSNSKRWRLTMPTNALNFRPAGIELSEELRTVTPDEQETLAKIFQATVTKALNNIRSRRVERISG